SFRKNRVQILVGLLVAAAAAFAYTVLLLIMSYRVAGHVISHQYTVGDYAVLGFYYAWMAGSTAYISQMWMRAQDNVVGLRRVFALLDLPAESDVGDQALAPVMRGVRFTGASAWSPTS